MMPILRFIMVVLICLPIGYLFLYLTGRLIEELKRKKRDRDEKRVVHNDRGNRRSR